MIDEVAEWKQKRASAELNDVHQFVEDQFNRGSTQGINAPAAFAQINSIP
jgi:hypothetical protein